MTATNVSTDERIRSAALQLQHCMESAHKPFAYSRPSAKTHLLHTEYKEHPKPAAKTYAEYAERYNGYYAGYKGAESSEESDTPPIGKRNNRPRIYTSSEIIYLEAFSWVLAFVGVAALAFVIFNMIF